LNHASSGKECRHSGLGSGHRCKAVRRRHAHPRANARAGEGGLRWRRYLSSGRHGRPPLMLSSLGATLRRKQWEGESKCSRVREERPGRGFCSAEAHREPSDRIRWQTVLGPALGPGGRRDSWPRPRLRPGRRGGAASGRARELGLGYAGALLGRVHCCALLLCRWAGQCTGLLDHFIAAAG